MLAEPEPSDPIRDSPRDEAGIELALIPCNDDAPIASPAELRSRQAQAAMVDDLLAAAAEREAKATEEIARLRERVRVLESWLEPAAEARSVEHIQKQRLALMQALQRDRRYAFVASLPFVLALLYVVVVGFVVWLVLAGRL
jgi:hypothetical protein